jgi:uncharacterized SAM-dependent methyltransferase
VLTRDLKRLGTLTSNGWIVISYDGNQDRESLYKAYQSRYFQRFIRNIFYRAAVELSQNRVGEAGFSDSYDPGGFDYEAAWIPSAHLLANFVVANKSQDFAIGAHSIHVKKGDLFLVLNSFKYTSDVFERGCQNANLQVVAHWADNESPTRLCVLRTPANDRRLHPTAV